MASNEEEILGKAYDNRLMKRLLKYLRPYRWKVGLALGSIVLKAGADVLGPFLTLIAVDKYLAPVHQAPSMLGDWLSPNPLTGIGQIAAIYVGLFLIILLPPRLQPKR